MPKYRVPMFREVIANDTLSRVIEAPDMDAAIAKAADLADEYNFSCPDDTKQSAEVVDVRNWQVGQVGDDVEADEVADSDGCATCAASIETRSQPCDECGHVDEDDSDEGTDA